MRWTARKCPACHTLCTNHCPTRGCRWATCPREACRAVIDYTARRGFQLLPGDVYRNFTWPA